MAFVAAEVEGDARHNQNDGGEGEDYPGGVGRLSYGGGCCVLGSRCGGGVAVGHGVKSVISGYGVACLSAAVGNLAADGADSDGFVGLSCR